MESARLGRINVRENCGWKTNSGAEKDGENVRGKVVSRAHATCSKLRRDDGRLKARVDELIVNNTACGYYSTFRRLRFFFIQSIRLFVVVRL